MMSAKEAVKKLFSIGGLGLSGRGLFVDHSCSVGEFQYEDVFPNPSYAPWKTDTDFIRVRQQITPYTLVDIYRCYELWDLVKQTEHLPGSVLEVGVWRGGTGCLLAARTAKPVYLCDTFTGIVKVTGKDTSYRGGEHADTSIATVEELARKLNVNPQIKQGIFPDDFPELAREQFAFVHIDVDIYQSSKDVFNAIWPNMPVGGIVVFDDYGYHSCDGVTRFVNELRGESDKIVAQNLNGHAVLIKTQ